MARCSKLRKQYFHGTSEERANPPAISQEVADKPPPRLSTGFPRIDRAFRARFDIAARMPQGGLKILPFFLINRPTRRNRESIDQMVTVFSYIPFSQLGENRDRIIIFVVPANLQLQNNNAAIFDWGKVSVLFRFADHDAGYFEQLPLRDL